MAIIVTVNQIYLTEKFSKAAGKSTNNAYKLSYTLYVNFNLPNHTNSFVLCNVIRAVGDYISSCGWLLLWGVLLIDATAALGELLYTPNLAENFMNFVWINEKERRISLTFSSWEWIFKNLRLVSLT